MASSCVAQQPPACLVRTAALVSNNCNYICPISYDIMEDPVRTVDGQIYDRAAITSWFEKRRNERKPLTSPLTNQELPSDALQSCDALKEEIRCFRRALETTTLLTQMLLSFLSHPVCSAIWIKFRLSLKV